jgi:hypothetical protein
MSDIPKHKLILKINFARLCLGDIPRRGLHFATSIFRLQILCFYLFWRLLSCDDMVWPVSVDSRTHECWCIQYNIFSGWPTGENVIPDRPVPSSRQLSRPQSVRLTTSVLSQEFPW